MRMCFACIVFCVAIRRNVSIGIVSSENIFEHVSWVAYQWGNKKRLAFTYHCSCVLLDNLLMCRTSEPLSHDYNNIAFWPKLQKLEFRSNSADVKLLGPYGYTQSDLNNPPLYNRSSTSQNSNRVHRPASIHSLLSSVHWPLSSLSSSPSIPSYS